MPGIARRHPLRDDGPAAVIAEGLDRRRAGPSRSRGRVQRRLQAARAGRPVPRPRGGLAPVRGGGMRTGRGRHRFGCVARARRCARWRPRRPARSGEGSGSDSGAGRQAGRDRAAAREPDRRAAGAADPPGTGRRRRRAGASRLRKVTPVRPAEPRGRVRRARGATTRPWGSHRGRGRAARPETRSPRCLASARHASGVAGPRPRAASSVTGGDADGTARATRPRAAVILAARRADGVIIAGRSSDTRGRGSSGRGDGDTSPACRSSVSSLHARPARPGAGRGTSGRPASSRRDRHRCCPARRRRGPRRTDGRACGAP